MVFDLHISLRLTICEDLINVHLSRAHKDIYFVFCQIQSLTVFYIAYRTATKRRFCGCIATFLNYGINKEKEIC